MIENEGEPWFVAKDVCYCLGLGNVGQTCSSLDEDEVKSDVNNIINNDVGNGGRPYLLISESGLYSLILRSRKPEAKAFRRWITHEVIPSIRKHGAYLTGSTIESILANPEYAVSLLMELAKG